jgi:hypothetical protein
MRLSFPFVPHSGGVTLTYGSAGRPVLGRRTPRSTETTALSVLVESTPFEKESVLLRAFGRITVAAAAALAVGTAFTSTGRADSTPVGPLPAGPTATIQTQKGQLVAFALPRRTGGRVWRVARAFDSGVLRQVSEANVGSSVVLVFRATGKGKTTVSFGLTRGERAKAYESRRFALTVR